MIDIKPEAHRLLAAEFKASRAENEHLRQNEGKLKTRLIDIAEECERLKKGHAATVEAKAGAT